MEDLGRHSDLGFGELLRYHRLAAGLSQQALAELARMSVNGISALERGYRRSPQRETIALLARALALTAEQRLGFEKAAGRPDTGHKGTSITVGPWPSAGVPSLPVPLSSFVGRLSELAELGALVREHRLVTVTGSGGVGKTRTALEVGRVLSDDDGMTVYFVALGRLGNPLLVLTAIGSALGIQEAPHHPLLDTLSAYLRDRALVLLLDNCEHVVGEVAIAVEALISRCPRLRILATSREPIRVTGERTFRLPSLSVPPNDEAPAINATEAVTFAAIALFCDRARAANHQFALTDQNVAAVIDVCRRLDGIPLALELAAARTNALSVKAISEQLVGHLEILTGAGRNTIPRHQTMRATLDWSYDLLSPQERLLFARLSVFSGGWTLSTARAVCVDEAIPDASILNLLSSLVDKSLVVADLDASEPRYRFLAVFRQYAEEKLAARSEGDEMARRHARTFLEVAEALDRCHDTEPDRASLKLARDELDNWREAIQWALTGEANVDLGMRLVGMLSVVWMNFHPLEGRRHIDRALSFVTQETPSDIIGNLLLAETIVAWQLREYVTQLTSAKKAIVAYERAGNVVGTARAKHFCGAALMFLERLDEAKVSLFAGLSEARGLHNPRLTAMFLQALCNVSIAENDVSLARTYNTEAQHIYESFGARIGLFSVLADRNKIELLAGNTHAALELATDTLSVLRAYTDVPITGRLAGAHILTLLCISQCYSILKRYGEASAAAREALQVAGEHHMDVYLANVLQVLATIAVLEFARGTEPQGEVFLRGARLLGYANSRLETFGSVRLGFLDAQYDAALSALRNSIGNDALAARTVEGSLMSEDEATREALSL